MKIAVWNNPVTRAVYEALVAAFGSEVVATSRQQAEDAVRSGLVDVALLPTDAALSASDDFDILPAVAVSTWINPYALLRVGSPLGSKTMEVAHGKEGRLAAILASIVLKEHYGTVVALSEKESLPEEFVADALISTQTGGQETDVNLHEITLDLGQEWFELCGYPFVWAVFVVRKGEANPDTIQAVREAVIKVDDNRVVFAERWEDDRMMQDFFLNDLRLRLDDMVIASLTELCDHLYFYGFTDELKPVVLASLPEEN